MTRIASFPPLAGQRVRLLILGTMPGVASLTARRYYAHPRNAFWPIMLGLLQQRDIDYGEAKSIPFAQRYRVLAQGGIALWDVLAECERPGSLDTAIRPGSIRCNDLAGFVARHPQLEALAFNGQAAARLYAHHAAPTVSELLKASGRELVYHRLPSTSPAMAQLDLTAKRVRWCRELRPYLPE